MYESHTPIAEPPANPIIPIGLSDSNYWARFFWWDGRPERLRAGLQAIRENLHGARRPWSDLVWVILSTRGCYSATNSCPALPVDAVRADDDRAVDDFWARVVRAYHHDLDIRRIVRERAYYALGADPSPFGSAQYIEYIKTKCWATEDTDIAILDV